MLLQLLMIRCYLLLRKSTFCGYAMMCLPICLLNRHLSCFQFWAIDEYLSMSLFSIPISSLWKGLFKSLAHFQLSRLFFIVVFLNSVYPGYTSFIRHVFCKIVLIFCNLSFHFCNSVIEIENFFHVDEVQFINLFSFMDCVF